ncbi:uncharacterized protein LOC135488191 isoform X2 [Lineus longissimus]
MDFMNTRGWCQAILAFFLVQIIGCYGYANRSVSACFDTQKTIRLACDAGYMVRIIQTFYGYSHTGQCAFKDGDCKLVDKEHYSCIGKQWCVINLPSGNLGNTIPGCSNKRSTYVQADYECIKASETVDICAVSEVTSQYGYITTPHYPRNYPNNKSCTITIRGRPTQTFTIDVLDFYLPVPSQTGCGDKLRLSSSTRELTLCGNRWNDRIFTTYQKNTSVKLEFTSDETSPMKGFWIYYEAIPLIPTPPPPPTTTSTSTTQKEDTTRPSGGSPGNSQNTSDGTEDIVKEKRRTGLPYPAAAIIGGVIGGLLLILAILVILLLIKRIREHKQLKASRTDLNTKRKTSNSHLQIQNNMGVTSHIDNNPSQFPSNNTCYNQSNNANFHPEYEGMRMENINSQNNCSDGGPGIIMC